MFVLRTGLQGNGKTLNTIKEVDEKAHKEKRTVYYCNVTGFKPDHPAIKADWIEFDHPETWFTLPQNALIVIDEAQTWFRVRPQGSKVPEYASRLEIMRKDGHELHAITQSPKLIDAHMRDLCNMHVHYNRGNGSQIVKRWVFQKPEMSVSSKLEFTDGESSRITIDKTYFGCYESVKEGSEHHFKFRPPKALYVFIVCVLLIAGAVWKISQRFVDPETATPPSESVAPGAQQIVQPSAPASLDPVTPDQYAYRMTPRIKDVPSSAPVYDQLTQAQSFPKPFCVSTRDTDMLERNSRRMTLGYDAYGKLSGCRCNSQQGTRLDVSFSFCMNVVDNGYFDHTKPDRQPEMRGSATASVGGRDDEVGTYARVGDQSPAIAAADRMVVVGSDRKPGDSW